MKFHFKLQPLLDKERIYEGEFIKGLKSLQGILREEEEKLEKIRRQKKECQKSLNGKLQINIESRELIQYEEYFLRLENEEGNCRCILDEITQKIEKVQEELNKIMKRRKALEKLKEKGLAEYLNNLQLSLQKEMDEIAVLNFSRRQ